MSQKKKYYCYSIIIIITIIIIVVVVITKKKDVNYNCNKKINKLVTTTENQDNKSVNGISTAEINPSWLIFTLQI